MVRLTTALLMPIGLLLMSHLLKYTIAQLKPMCISQFALANHACAFLPAIESLTDRNSTRIPATADNDDDDDDDDGDNDDDAEPERDNHNRRGNGNHGRRQRHENGNGHGHGHEHRHRHINGSGHRQRHGHGHEHREGTRAERDCCRWLDDIDEECVCTVLLPLPRFLTRPRHQYGVKVGDSCVRTFKCGGI